MYVILIFFIKIICWLYVWLCWLYLLQFILEQKLLYHVLKTKIENDEKAYSLHFAVVRLNTDGPKILTKPNLATL